MQKGMMNCVLRRLRGITGRYHIPVVGECPLQERGVCTGELEIIMGWRREYDSDTAVGKAKRWLDQARVCGR